jgi:RES domain-containing protein
MDYADGRFSRVDPVHLDRQVFVRAYNTDVKTKFGRRHFFDSEWSYARGYRYNFKGTQPVLYLAADSLAATFEIGPRTRADLLVPHLQNPVSPYIYVSVGLTADLLDLTDPEVRLQLDVPLDELLASTEVWEEAMDRGEWLPTHVIGQLAAQDGRFAGILYPPYPIEALGGIPDKQNVALFMDPSAPAMARPQHGSVTLEVEDPGGILAALDLIY